MKFTRNIRSLRNPFEVAPFAAVFFLLTMFLMVATLLPTPGIPLQLPVSESSPGQDLPGTDQPTVSLAVDASGRYYFANQIVTEAQLKSGLAAAIKKSPEPLTLVIHADQTVTYGQLVSLTLLAHAAGIQNTLLATLPRFASPAGLER